MPDDVVIVLTTEQKRRALLTRSQQAMLALQDRINSAPRRTLQQVMGERCGPPPKPDWRPKCR